MLVLHMEVSWWFSLWLVGVERTNPGTWNGKPSFLMMRAPATKKKIPMTGMK